jgi:hypothetical protein
VLKGGTVVDAGTAPNGVGFGGDYSIPYAVNDAGESRWARLVHDKHGRQIVSGIIRIAPQGHSETHMPQPLQ